MTFSDQRRLTMEWLITLGVLVGIAVLFAAVVRWMKGD